MKNIALMSDVLNSIIFLILIASPIVCLVGLITAAVSTKTRKIGIKIMIGAAIAFVIGFGTCLANFNISPK